MYRRGFLAFLLVAVVSLLGGTVQVSAQATGAVVTYGTGYQIISAPPGTDVSAASGALYTLQPGDTSGYESISPALGTKAGYGYWAYFDQPTKIALAGGALSPYSVLAPAGRYIMIGNPSGTEVATVSGADTVYTYDPTGGFVQTNALYPGRGAFAVSNAGGQISVTPATPGSFNTVTSPRGYQVDVPSEWQRSSSIPSDFPSPQNVGLLVTTPDGGANAIALVRIDTTDVIPAADRNNLPQFITDLLNQDAKNRNVQSSFQLSAPAESVNVPGADAAALGGGNYTDSQGVAQSELILIAVRGNTLYRFVVEPTLAYLQSHQDELAHLTASFRLVPPTA